MIVGTPSAKPAIKLLRRPLAPDDDDRPGVRLVYLAGSRALIAERLAARRGHFMPASLLDSQFAAFEPPLPKECAIAVSVDAPVAAIVARIAASLAPAGTIPGEGRLTG